MASTKKYPGQCTEAHPELYDVRAMPEQSTTLKPGQLPPARIKEFFEKGYLVVENFFTDAEIDSCLKGVEGIVDRVAHRIKQAGHLKNLHEDKDVFTRLIYINEQYPDATILTHKDGVLPKEFQDLFSNERLLNFLEQIFGPTFCANPIWNIRPKAPNNPDGAVPWHQDSGYFDPASYKTFLPVVWVPLLDVTPENGCLQILEGGHKTGLVADHLNCYGNTWHVMLDESKMEKTLDVSLEKDLRTLPIKKGSFILFNNLVPHRSLPNTGNVIRWSLDLRYQKPGLPEGLYGKMPLIPLRDASNPGLVPDWSPYEANRHIAQRVDETGKVKDLDATLTGPWMKNWRLVNGNRHTEAAGLVVEGPER